MQYVKYSAKAYANAGDSSQLIKKDRLHRARGASGEGERGANTAFFKRPPGGALQCLAAIALSSTSHTAPMAAARVVDLRHTAPTVRVGAGLLNSRTVSPRCEPNGESTANSGSKVMPSPATTICRKVSRLVARKSSASWTSTRLHTSSAWSRRQWPSSSSSRVWSLRSCTLTVDLAASTLPFGSARVKHSL